VNISLKAPQAVVFSSEKRFRVLVAGRRFGKPSRANGHPRSRFCLRDDVPE
jgi:hypothetical protein